MIYKLLYHQSEAVHRHFAQIQKYGLKGFKYELDQ